jgi:hypothetical protein
MQLNERRVHSVMHRREMSLNVICSVHVVIRSFYDIHTAHRPRLNETSAIRVLVHIHAVHTYRLNNHQSLSPALPYAGCGASDRFL